jgi:hypothetical protein
MPDENLVEVLMEAVCNRGFPAVINDLATVAHELKFLDGKASDPAMKMLNDLAAKLEEVASWAARQIF